MLHGFEGIKISCLETMLEGCSSSSFSKSIEKPLMNTSNSWMFSLVPSWTSWFLEYQIAQNEIKKSPLSYIDNWLNPVSNHCIYSWSCRPGGICILKASRICFEKGQNWSRCSTVSSYILHKGHEESIVTLRLARLANVGRKLWMSLQKLIFIFPGSYKDYIVVKRFMYVAREFIGRIDPVCKSFSIKTL